MSSDTHLIEDADGAEIVATVPIKVTIKFNDVVLHVYEDEATIPFDDMNSGKKKRKDMTESQRNVDLISSLMDNEGMDLESALLEIVKRRAGKLIADAFADGSLGLPKNVISRLNGQSLGVIIAPNGDIRYSQQVKTPTG